ncbi:hypothetical protein [Leptospira sp. 'Mane']|uniref:hypothetical protein n=1 Tax=Leptospira sp. 'Mane' TaxID=3387407 RepID=UPI00398B3FE0
MILAMSAIVEKIGIIDAITDQTNLLALNAAIEAAKNSVLLAEKAGNYLDEIVPNIQKTSHLVQDISTGIRQMHLLRKR